ncbi:MAG: SDR family oxidoreductase [Prosthecobacter sp.]|jgi:NAD(P)-dependent dehydrogenase (short-subunit alcohol dehydrogenase family)|uniref:SDR family NAD(P)-dependent oxidoreductase n=1 Tax=Prosthecobacter sp. TaxID=1965333 RepID=UPI0019FE1309|nr:SDR family oxidoreductase [Prosthecobacter sp.]MBE2284221.1 SDR family oxidoreductase [Prosthecobacter sp.]
MPVLDHFNLAGRRALITGGSRGLGLEMARALAEAGAEVIITGTSEENLRQACESITLDQCCAVTVIQADLSKPEEAERLCDVVLHDHAPIDILINNVGGRRINTPTEDLALEDWQRIVDLNLTQAFILTKRIGAAMIPRQWGRIINISSINALWPGKAMRGRSYETSKGALTMFTKAVAADWAVHGITVNAIAPGPFLTDANRRWIGEKPEFEGEVAASIPMGRWGRPEEIGPLALYLASDASSYMTGSLLVIDGGKLLW